MNSKRHIALVTTWFPPKMSVATNRMLAFAEYLSDEFEVTVIALDDKNHKLRWNNQFDVHYVSSTSVFDKLRSNPKDSKFKHKFKTGLRILVSKIAANPLKSWQNDVTVKLKELHQQKAFDVVISSYAPQEAHLAVIPFIKENKGVRWIADMRDEMSKNPGVSAGQKLNYQKTEALINQFADAITSVSKPIVDDFKILCPDIKYFEEVRNGFNHSLTFDANRNNDLELIKIGYFGTFYGEIKPTNVFNVLASMLSNYNIEVHVYGGYSNFSIPKELIGRVKSFPGLPYLEAIEKMNTMNFNLLIHPTNARKGVFTGKLFDYLSAKQPVLAFIDETDVAAELLNDLNAGYVCDNTNLEKMKATIELAISEKRAGIDKTAKMEGILSLHRKSQVEKLSNLINHLLS